MKQTPPIRLIPLKSNVAVEDLPQQCPLFVCDFHLIGCEQGIVHPETETLYYRGIVLVDHHAALRCMERHISSANIAIAHVRRYGPAQFPVIINHTDCDSVLSSAIMAGRLPPEDRYGIAAIAADHTGEENNIANLLQGLDRTRDWEYSVRMLECLESKKSLDAQATQAIATIRAQRAKAKSLAPRFRYTNNGIAYCHSDIRVDGVFLPPLLSDAKLIVLSMPMANGNLEVKVRLGRQANGIRLNKLPLPQFGARWNAGSTERSGGTTYSLEEYVRIVEEKVREYEGQNK